MTPPARTRKLNGPSKPTIWNLKLIIDAESIVGREAGNRLNVSFAGFPSVVPVPVQRLHVLRKREHVLLCRSAVYERRKQTNQTDPREHLQQAARRAIPDLAASEHAD